MYFVLQQIKTNVYVFSNEVFGRAQTCISDFVQFRGVKPSFDVKLRSNSILRMASGFQYIGTNFCVFGQQISSSPKPVNQMFRGVRRFITIFDANIRGTTFYESISDFGIPQVMFTSFQIWVVGSSKCAYQMLRGPGWFKITCFDVTSQKTTSSATILFGITPLFFTPSIMIWVSRKSLHQTLRVPCCGTIFFNANLRKERHVQSVCKVSELHYSHL